MPIRLTGMISGMDTDSLIKGMVDAQRLKNKKTTDKSVLLDFKQEKWKELNAKLYKLYQEDLSKLRFQGNYGTKKVTTSNDALVTVKGNSNAPTGTSNLKIFSTATAQTVTSGELGSGITEDKKLSELAGSEFKAGSEILITNGNKKTVFEVGENTTIKDFVSALKTVGLNANYDSSQQRLFISSKESGENNKFTITQNAAGTESIKDMVGYSSLDAEKQGRVLDALAILNNEEAATADKEAATETLKELAEDKKREEVKTALKNQAIEDVKGDISSKLLENSSQEALIKEHIEKIIRAEMASGDGETLSEEEIQEAVEKRYNETKSEHNRIFKDIVDLEYSSTEFSEEDNTKTKAEYYEEQVEQKFNTQMASVLNETETTLRNIISKYSENTSPSDMLSALKLGEVTGAGDSDHALGMRVQAAQNATIEYNGANISSNTNTFNVNGMEITVKGKSQEGEIISLNVSNDTQANYDMVKKFVTNYNAILKEMNDLFYAPSAKGYDPLSDEEKEAMTDKQIERWEDKIKESILRRDDALGSTLNAMKSAMMSVVEVDGKRYSLSSFGIGTSTDYTEKGLLHIDGDADDPLVSDMVNKLMKALEEDPETVTKVLAGVTQKLYTAMDDKMKSIPNVRSKFSFYNDKTMEKQQKDYGKKIKELEKKLVEIENKYYKQFAAMEKAMAQLQSQSNALAGLLGQGGN